MRHLTWEEIGPTVGPMGLREAYLLHKNQPQRLCQQGLGLGSKGLEIVRLAVTVQRGLIDERLAHVEGARLLLQFKQHVIQVASAQ